MIEDNAHAARLQARYEESAAADDGPQTPHICTEARTLGALIGLLDHDGHEVAADMLRRKLVDMFPAITYGMVSDGPAPYSHWSVTAAQLGIDALESDYAGNPAACVAWLASVHAPVRGVVK